VAAGYRVARLPVREVLGPKVIKAVSLNIDTVFQTLLEWVQLEEQRANKTEEMTREQQIEQWRHAFQKSIAKRHIKT
jgi:hypothetical protein